MAVGTSEKEERLEKEKIKEELERIREFCEKKLDHYLSEADKVENLAEEERLEKMNEIAPRMSEIISILLKIDSNVIQSTKVKRVYDFLCNATNTIVDENAPDGPRGFSYPDAEVFSARCFPDSLVPIGNCSVLEGLVEVFFAVNDKRDKEKIKFAIEKLVSLLLREELRKNGLYYNAYFFRIIPGYNSPSVLKPELDIPDLWTTSTVIQILKTVYKISQKEIPTIYDNYKNRIEKVIRDSIEGTLSILDKSLGEETEGESPVIREIRDLILSDEVKGISYLVAVSRILLAGLDDKGEPEEFLRGDENFLRKYKQKTKAWLRIALNKLRYRWESIDKEDRILTLAFEDRREPPRNIDELDPQQKRKISPLFYIAKVLIELSEKYEGEIIEVALEPFQEYLYPLMGVFLRKSLEKLKREKDTGMINLASFLLNEYYQKFDTIERTFFGKPKRALERIKRPEESIIMILRPEFADSREMVRVQILRQGEFIDYLSSYRRPKEEIIDPIGKIGEGIEGVRRIRGGESNKVTVDGREYTEENIWEYIEKECDNLIRNYPSIDLIKGKPTILLIPPDMLNLAIEMPLWHKLQEEGGTPIISRYPDLVDMDIDLGKYLAIRKEDFIINVLLIGDPSGNLRYAREEVEEIYKKLSSLELRGYELYIEKRIGERNKGIDVEEMKKLLNKRRWDILHFAGHAEYNEKQKTILWVFDRGNFPVVDVAGSSTFIFANACATAATNEIILNTPIQILRKGTISFIGTLVPVSDEPAKIFSGTFYENFLQGKTVGEAFARAINALHTRKYRDWASYVLYGDPRFKLIHA
ncbi:MAG: hypothetical protein DSO07_09780 [Thermoproteota archaeon]|jgi:hypothetical protein|uniref:CHAT domain-containing protein n=1 Tax=Candidatus Methanodesulfokora washburnensis TaxID=2478471 RepID=A0A429GPG1_9CREN|nr:CHAT domain-containing protein [Candidatus Methanodesulfokores washburnensis]RSN75770.1 CHAT domain-containing protein [Candidatus Methanodesulfokores washburnensis]RZN60001.1 MAG: CHAT domain-containing protein [Candidatus Methanodesulfokores washburnensis]TDA39928.1 MAG: hypothetical protein DSO07_09780 [Candidatus Korarchaeota archaeon]